MSTEGKQLSFSIQRTMRLTFLPKNLIQQYGQEKKKNTQQKHATSLRLKNVFSLDTKAKGGQAAVG